MLMLLILLIFQSCTFVRQKACNSCKYIIKCILYIYIYIFYFLFFYVRWSWDIHIGPIPTLTPLFKSMSLCQAVHHWKKKSHSLHAWEILSATLNYIELIKKSLAYYKWWNLHILRSVFVDLGSVICEYTCDIHYLIFHSTINCCLYFVC